MGGINNRGNGWVIRPDGSQREADYNPHEGNLVWNQILPGELVLRYHQASRSDIAHCEVVYRPETVTPAQLATAKQLEEDMKASENAFGLDQRLTEQLDRRKMAIEVAMAELPEALRPVDGWDYQVLVSSNGVHLEASAGGWVNHATPFDASCEGREAQVVYGHPAADGVLEALAYYKWGYWNLNLRWREDASVRPMAQPEGPAASQPEDVPDQGPVSAAALAALRDKLSGGKGKK
jgi:hypothetical protein